MGEILTAGTFPTVSIGPANVIPSDGRITEGASPSPSRPPSAPVTVNYATSDGTAGAGVDYVAIPSTPLTFMPGQTQQDVPVTVDAEPAGAALARRSTSSLEPGSHWRHDSREHVGLGTILAPNSMPAVSIAPATVLASSGGSDQAIFAVTLSAPVRHGSDRRLRHGRRHGKGRPGLRRHSRPRC